MAYKMKTLKERVSPRKYEKHLAKLDAHRDAKGIYHKKKLTKKAR